MLEEEKSIDDIIKEAEDLIGLLKKRDKDFGKLYTHYKKFLILCEKNKKRMEKAKKLNPKLCNDPIFVIEMDNFFETIKINIDMMDLTLQVGEMMDEYGGPRFELSGDGMIFIY